MQNLYSGLTAAMKAQGVELREFCSFCPNAKTGSVTATLEPGETIELPCCLDCAKIMSSGMGNNFSIANAGEV